MKNKNIKRILKATSALFALSLSANAFAEDLVGAAVNIDLAAVPAKNYTVTEKSNTAAGEVTVTIDATKTPTSFGTLTKSTGVAPTPPAVTPVAVPYTGKITAKLNGAIDKAGLDFTNDYFKNVQAVTLENTGEGYVKFSAPATFFETATSGTSQKLGAFATQVIDASKGDQKIHLVLDGTDNLVRKEWIKYGKDTKLKIQSVADASFEADTTFTAENIAEVKIDMDGHALNFGDAAAVKSIVFTNDADDQAKGFKDGAVIDSVSFKYEGAAAVDPKNGAFGYVEAVNKDGAPINLTIKKLGAEKFAVRRAIATTDKTLTLGEKGGSAYLNEVQFVGNGAKVVFDGKNLSAVDLVAINHGRVTATNVNFSNTEKGIFTVTAENPELNVRFSNVPAQADASKKSKFVVTNGATLVGNQDLDFTHGVVEITEGDLVINNSSNQMLIGTVKRTAGEKAAKSAGVIVKLQENAENALLNTTTFQFGAENEKMHLGLGDTVVGNRTHPVNFSAYSGQVFTVKDGYVKIKPKFALGSDAKYMDAQIVVSKGATLVGGGANYLTGAHDFNAIAAGANGALNDYAEFKKETTKTTFFDKLKNSIKIEDGGALMLESLHPANNYVPVIVGKVSMSGTAILKSDKSNTDSEMILYANEFDIAANTDLKLDGKALLAGYDGKELKFNSITGLSQDNGADMMRFFSPVSVSGDVTTSLATNQSFSANKFASGKKDQSLEFRHNGSDEVVAIKGSVVDGSNKYSEVVFNATGNMTYEGNIDSAVLEAVVVADKSLTFNTSEIKPDKTYFSGNGVIKFSKDVVLNSEVYGAAPPAPAPAAANLDFQKVTLKKNFDNNLANVKATEIVVVTPTVTMKSLEAPKLEFNQDTTLNLTEKLKNVALFNLKDSQVTVGNSVSFAEGSVLSLKLGKSTSGKLIANGADSVIDLRAAKISIDAAKHSDLWKVGQKFEFAEAGSSIISNDNALAKTSPFYTLKIVNGDGDKKVSLEVVSVRDTGEVLREKSRSSVVSSVVSDNLTTISEAVKAKQENREIFGGLLDSVKESLSNESEVNFAKVASGVPGGDKIALNNFSSGMTKVLDNHLGFISAPVAALGAGSPADDAGSSLWVEGVMSGGTQKVAVANKDDVENFTDSSRAVMFGADYRISDNSLVGIVVGIGEAELKYSGDRSGNVDNVTALAVAGYASQNFGDFFLSEKGGFAKLSSSRSFARANDMGVFDEKNTIAKADPIQYFFGVTAGYNIRSSEFVTIAPMAKVNFENMQAYNEVESGSSIGNFKIENQDRKSVYVSGGASLKSSFDVSEDVVAMPDIHGFFNYDVMSNEESRKIKVSSAKSSGASIELKEANLSPASWEIGAGLLVKSSSGFEFAGRIDGRFREKYMGWLGSVKLRLEF